MYYCNNCGAEFETPKIQRENYGLEGPYYDEIPVCPMCGDTDYIEMVLCTCCQEWTPPPHIVTDDDRIYCENCYHKKE